MPNKNGTTPMVIASKHGHTETVKLLAQLGANIETPNENGTTPVFISAQEGHTETVKALVETGADVNVTSKVSAASSQHAA